MTRQQLYADLPAELLEADDVLRRYGRWCRGGSGPARCGSAEGNYRAPQDDEDRQPAEPIMPRADVDRVRQALGELPMMTLCVIQWLYVTPGQVQRKMRETGLQPKHLRERHLEGVRLFWNALRKSNATMTNDTIAIRSVVIENCTT
jgi:hypothetical protein